MNMEIGEYIWYNTGDLINPPQKAKILRINNITSTETEYICKQNEGGYRVILKSEQMFELLSQAKDAKIKSIEASIQLLNDNILIVKRFTEI